VLPTNGSIKISGLVPEMAAFTWPGAIAYGPQEVHMISGSLKQNIAMGFNEEEISDEYIWKSLKQANLMGLAGQVGNDIRSKVYGPDNDLSGGQKQRIGIARALYSSPSVLFLDESTSSLDVQTEQEIVNNIIVKMKDITRVVIAHRISTIRSADRIAYLKNGVIVTIGTYRELKEQIPDFDNNEIV